MKTTTIGELGVTTLISNATNIKTRNITRGKEGYFIAIEEPIYQENIIIINVHTPHNRASKYMKQKLNRIKSRNRPFDNSIRRGVDTPFMMTGRTTRF